MKYILIIVLSSVSLIAFNFLYEKKENFDIKNATEQLDNIKKSPSERDLDKSTTYNFDKKNDLSSKDNFDIGEYLDPDITIQNNHNNEIIDIGSYIDPESETFQPLDDKEILIGDVLDPEYDLYDYSDHIEINIGPSLEFDDENFESEKNSEINVTDIIIDKI